MFIGALEAGGTQMICSIGTEQGGVLQRAAFQTLTPEETIPQIVEFLTKFDIKALGIGAFGPLDLEPSSPAYGSITNTPKAAWRGYPLLAELKKQLRVPAAIDTGVNACALAEYRMGAGRGLGSLLYVSVDAGVGGGYVAHGRTAHGLVHPELGHMIMRPEPSDTMPEGVCPFHKGCLEGLASGPAMEKRWGLAPKLMTAEHPAWTLEAAYLSQLCANAVLTLSPEIIVLGGSVMRQAQLLPMIREKTLALLGGYVDSPKLTPEGIGAYIVTPALGANAGVTGALLLAAQALEGKR